MNQIAKAKNAAKSVRVRPMSREVAEVRHNINMIQEAMKATMKNDVHYGVIPGCGKPSLYKAGAETLLALFKLTFVPKVQDLSQDGEIRYLVTMELSTRDGVLIGSGIGECSSQEEKYMWRKAVSDKEWEATDDRYKRIKYKPTYEINQVRVNPSDMANTILKMAKKRALIDGILSATAASDIFTQDIQDLPEGVLPEDIERPTETPQEPPVEQTQPEQPPEQENSEEGKGWGEEEEEPMDDVPIVEVPKEAMSTMNMPEKKSGPVISQPQAKRLFAICMGAKFEKADIKPWLFGKFGYSSTKDILKSDYEKICESAAKGGE